MTEGGATETPAFPPLQLEEVSDPARIGGMEVITARLRRGPGTRRSRKRLWVAAVTGSDLHAGRGGFGLSEAEAVMDLFRYLRFLNARVPEQRG